MPPFRFRLEQVLSYRKSLEEQAMLALAGATRRRDGLLAYLKELRAAQDQQQERLCGAHLLTSAERWFLHGYLDALEQERKETQEALRLAEEEVDRSRRALVDKAQGRSLLSGLKDRQGARHALLERHKEQRELDEIAILRHQNSSI
ncbi:MAG: flagellar export protein FliJ [Desulfovibrio sp.]|jgi:flagellar FliJ protein|nr:flagellar export protein FliJ [Desulfovibrio sp.]